MFYASKIPGPADFDPQPLKNRGSKFSNANPKSDVEWLIYHASMKPGVGEYDLVKSFKNLICLKFFNLKELPEWE